MSSSTVLKHHLKFETNIKQLIYYGLNVANDGYNPKSEKKSTEEKKMLLEALLLRACALWESFLEKEIVILVKLDPSKFKVAHGLSDSTKLNEKIIRAIIFSDRYRDFNDIDSSKGYFRKVLVDEYNLFEDISNEQIKKLIFTYKMRNYLSHYSIFSKDILFISYKKDYHYRKFVEPGLYLLTNKGQNFENLIHNLILISIKMKKRML